MTSKGTELYQAAVAKQLRRTRDALEKLGRWRYGPADAVADAAQAWLDAAELFGGLGELWLECVEGRRETPRCELDPLPEPGGPVRVEITELGYGKVE